MPVQPYTVVPHLYQLALIQLFNRAKCVDTMLKVMHLYQHLKNVLAFLCAYMHKDQLSN